VTALDDALGPANGVGHITKKVGRTCFPRAEERLRPYLDAFLLEVRRIAGDDYTPPHVYMVAWTAGARELAQVLAEDKAADFMPWAFHEYDRAFPGQRPHSPRSLLFLVERWKPNSGWESVLCDTCFQRPCVCEEDQ
jgi:hypothetical protein